MKVQFIRQMVSTTVAHSMLFARKIPASTLDAVWWEVHTSHWTTGARTRVRKLPSLKRVIQYLENLNHGGWLSSSDFQAVLLDIWVNSVDLLWEAGYCRYDDGGIRSIV